MIVLTTITNLSDSDVRDALLFTWWRMIARIHPIKRIVVTSPKQRVAIFFRTLQCEYTIKFINFLNSDLLHQNYSMAHYIIHVHWGN